MRLKKLSPLLSTTLSGFIKRGNKASVEALFVSVLAELKKTHGERYLEFFENSLLQLAPRVRLRSKKKAGIVYRIPVPLTSSKTSLSFASRWFRQAVHSRSERGLETRLLRELQDASNRRGEGVRKRNSVHSTALLNRGFIRYLK